MVEWIPLLMVLALLVCIFSGVPVAFVLAGVGLGALVVGVALDAARIDQLSIAVLRVYRNVGENQMFSAVPMLILMGVVLESSGVAERLLFALAKTMRDAPGSHAIAVIIIGLVFATATGVLGASVAMLASAALPVMLARRYDPALASGVIGAAGTLGVIMPPAVLLFFLCDAFESPIAHVFLGMLVPVAILASAYAAYALFASRKLTPAEQVRGDELPAWKIFADLAPPVFLVFLVLGSILYGWATPTESASIGAAGALLIAAFNRSLSRAMLRAAFERALEVSAMVFLIVACATVFSLPFQLFGGSDLFVKLMRNTGLSDPMTLALVLLIVFLLGFVLDWLEILFIMMPIFLPVLMKLNFAEHVGAPELVLPWLAVLFALNLNTSFLTPPFGFALFFLKGAAPPSVRLIDIYRGVVPFVLIQIAALLAVALFPQIALFLPRAMLH